jgi:hypothetical protein
MSKSIKERFEAMRLDMERNEGGAPMSWYNKDLTEKFMGRQLRGSYAEQGVLFWMSRHEQSPEQYKSLVDDYADNGIRFNSTEIINATFPARSDELAVYMDNLIQWGYLTPENSAIVIAGVFPAHIAVKLVSYCSDRGYKLSLPVSVPAPAKDGEVRGGGFIHNHWEHVVV